MTQPSLSSRDGESLGEAARLLCDSFVDHVASAFPRKSVVLHEVPRRSELLRGNDPSGRGVKRRSGVIFSHSYCFSATTSIGGAEFMVDISTNDPALGSDAKRDVFVYERRFLNGKAYWHPLYGELDLMHSARSRSQLPLIEGIQPLGANLGELTTPLNRPV